MAAELSPQDRRALRKIAERLTRVEKAQRRNVRTAQGPYRSLEGGSQEVYDDDGVLRGVIGEQADGTYTRIDLNAPAPVQPAEPTVGGGAGVLVVASYGLAADLSDWPLDFARFDVHVGAPGFVHSAASKVAEFTVDGGAITLALDAGTYEALLVAVNTSGVESVESPRVAGIVFAPTVGAGGVSTYHTDEPPVGLDAADDGALWYDTNAGNLPNRWDGSTLAWVPMPIGGSGLTDDAVDGKTITGATIQTAETGHRVVMSSGAEANRIRFEADDAGFNVPAQLWHPVGEHRLLIQGPQYVDGSGQLDLFAVARARLLAGALGEYGVDIDAAGVVAILGELAATMGDGSVGVGTFRDSVDARVAAQVDPLDTRVDTLEAALDDTGWVTLVRTAPTEWNDWEDPTYTVPLQYRRLHGVVYLQGQIERTGGNLVAGSGYTASLATLPVGARPSQNLITAVDSGDPGVGLQVKIETNGTMTIRNRANVETFNTGQFALFNISFVP